MSTGEKFGLQDLKTMTEKGIVVVKENPKYKNIQTTDVVAKLANEILHSIMAVFNEYAKDHVKHFAGKLEEIDAMIGKGILDLRQQGATIKKEMNDFGQHLEKTERDLHNHIVSEAGAAANDGIKKIDKALDAIVEKISIEGDRHLLALNQLNISIGKEFDKSKDEISKIYQKTLDSITKPITYLSAIETDIKKHIEKIRDEAIRETIKYMTANFWSMAFNCIVNKIKSFIHKYRKTSDLG